MRWSERKIERWTEALTHLHCDEIAAKISECKTLTRRDWTVSHQCDQMMEENTSGLYAGKNLMPMALDRRVSRRISAMSTESWTRALSSTSVSPRASMPRSIASQTTFKKSNASFDSRRDSGWKLLIHGMGFNRSFCLTVAWAKWKEMEYLVDKVGRDEKGQSRQSPIIPLRN